MTRLSKLHPDLRSFGREVAAESERSIDLLRDIESTLSQLNRLAGQLHADAVYAEKSIEAIKNIKAIIDPDDSISELLEKAQNCTGSLYNELVSRRQAGRNDSRLTELDGIEEAYTEAIEATADLHNLLNTLRWAVNEHDADMSAVSEPFTNSGELIKYLKG